LPANKQTMSTKTRSILKVIAILIVLLTVIMKLDLVIIPALSAYTYWLVVMAFGLLWISSK
jgi:hypothetical protein